jgi:hypothetical protein
MAKIDWAWLQANSDDVLADAFEALRAKPAVKAATVRDDWPCNYLLSLKGEPRYAGEGRNAQARLKQQFREATSTFYKTYLKRTEGRQPAGIAEFDVQVMETKLGRKELEEFAIVQIAAPLSKLGKREVREPAENTGLWEVVQAQRDTLLEQGAAAAWAAKAKPWFDWQPPSAPGIYVVVHQGKLIYIGESPDLAERHETHSDQTWFSALRRHIGTELLGYELAEVGGRKRTFTDDQDWKVTRFLTDCEAVFHPVSFGRHELEELLIRTQGPVLNRKHAPA